MENEKTEKKKKDRTPKTWKTCEIIQQLEYMSAEDVESGLDHNAIKDYAYILHDKDVNDDGSPKAVHWHIYIRFKDSTPTDSICKWFGITSNYIGRIQGRFADALAYATHRNVPEKYQYLDEEVKSNFDFVKERDTARSKEADKQRKAEISDLIISGVIKEYNYTDYITIQEYDRFRKSIDNAFKYRLDKIKGEDRDMEVIYIFGDSSCGKTTYAKELAAQNEYSCYVSSGGEDVLDDYKGQDCVILDDLRANDINFSSLLKLLDNHTQSMVRARYHNKFLECKLMIITTSKSMEELFRELPGSDNEDITQLRRRCKLYIKMTPLTMTIRMWQPESLKYLYVQTLDNPVHGRYATRDKSLDEAKAYVNNVLFFPKVATAETMAKGEGFRELTDDEADLFSDQMKLPL